MRRILVTVLYEDQRGPVRGFGLHDLVKACVFDALGGQRHLLEGALDGNPRGPNNQLLRSCRADAELLSRDGRRLVALFDGDRVRELLGLRPDATAAQVEQKVKEGSTAPDKLTVLLLDRNMEDVVAAAGSCDATINRSLLQRALGKQLEARDLVLAGAARAGKESVRACILKKVPSLNDLVELLCQILRGHL
jgi:hypothetical protein